MKKTALFLLLAFSASAEDLNVSYFNLETMTQKYRPDTVKDFSGAIYTKKGNYQVFKKTLGNLDFSTAQKKETFFGKLSDYTDLQQKLAKDSPLKGNDAHLQSLQQKEMTTFAEHTDGISGTSGPGALLLGAAFLIATQTDELRADNEYIMVEEAIQGNKKGKITTLFVCDSKDYEEAEIKKIMEKQK